MKEILVLLLIIIGVVFIITSIRTLLNKLPDMEHDTALSKRLLSPYTRYWIGRYYAGFNGILAGVTLLAMAIILYLSK